MQAGSLRYLGAEATHVPAGSHRCGNSGMARRSRWDFHCLRRAQSDLCFHSKRSRVDRNINESKDGANHSLGGSDRLPHPDPAFLLDELIGLPHLLFGGPFFANWRESAVETVAMLVVWLAVHIATRRVLLRFRYLEKLLPMCAWVPEAGAGRGMALAGRLLQQRTRDRLSRTAFARSVSASFSTTRLRRQLGRNSFGKQKIPRRTRRLGIF